MREDAVSPADFEDEFQRCRDLLAHSRLDRERIRQLAQLVHDDRAEPAADQIVSLVYAGRRPPTDLFTIWLRGGAVFWSEDHVSLGEGWPLHEWFDEFPDLMPSGAPDQAVRALRDNWESIQPYGQLYGEIPIQAGSGATATMISICSFASTDMPLCVVRSSNFFMRMVRLTGTLWGPDFPGDDPMQASDDILAKHLERASRFVRP